MFSCEFCEISKNIFFYRTPPDDCFWNSFIKYFLDDFGTIVCFTCWFYQNSTLQNLILFLRKLLDSIVYTSFRDCLYGKRDGTIHGMIRIQSFTNKSYVVFIWSWDIFHTAPARRDPTRNRLESRQKRDKNLDVNASSRDDFEIVLSWD